MFTIHCTAKLLATLKVAPASPTQPTTRLGNWYANHLAGPRSRIVCISERTHLPVIIERCSAAHLPRALADGLAVPLSELGVPAGLIEQERFAMAQASWAKTQSAVLRGVLTEQAFMAASLLEDGGHLPTADLTRQVARNIVKLQFPSERTREAFGLEARTHRGRDEGVTERVFDARSELSRRGLAPLALHPVGEWRPDEEHWGEEGEPLPKWARAIIKQGPRPAFEMEQVVPGQDLSPGGADPITASNELKYAGRTGAAMTLLYKLLEADVRCLDAHAHLGNGAFDYHPEEALRHYRAGVAIGELSLGAEFRGVLPWGFIDNRPWLRCLHGLALCLWRLGHPREAGEVFTRMLWLNPSDNQGARFNLDRIEQGLAWSPDD
jgi:hypothetical protein